MTAVAVARLKPEQQGSDVVVALWQRITPEFLAEVQWSPTRQTIAFDRDHRLLPWGRHNRTAEEVPSEGHGTGSCLVTSCPCDAAGKGRYCPAHRAQWAGLKRHHPGADEHVWRRDPQSAEARTRVVDMSRLAPQVVAQLLVGLQARVQNGSITRGFRFRHLCRLAEELGVTSIENLSATDGRGLTQLRNTIVVAAQRALQHPDTERRKDVWDLTVFGVRGRLDFTGLSQLWLREAAKLWAFDFLPTRSGRNVGGAVAARILAVTRLSESLRLQRVDGGSDHTAVGTTDITAFTNRMAFLQANGALTARLRLSTCRMVKIILDGFRLMGLTRPGQCLAGLPDDFALRRGQIPDDTDDDEPGKDLPQAVMRAICEALPLLGQFAGPDRQAAIELLIDTGRRPVEICELRWDCLSTDADGQPVLIYDNLKSRRLGRRLPIPAGTAQVVAAQQARVLDQFSHVPAGDLKLFPSARANPDGRRTLATGTLSELHRRWLKELPAITVPTEARAEDQVITVQLPYDLSKINIYAYRHTYAQRHADAGVPVDVLRELMDHRRMDTTQRYYNIGDHRRREAIDRVAQMQFDRHGSRIWRDARTLLDDERLRLAVGEVAVPYGGCSEPANVTAGGNACPIRFRCVGCGHFRTDASYLPDLEAYLADLLRNRERILASTVDADGWALQDALPATEEITRVRRLVERMTTELDELTPQERAEIEHAVAIVRRGRVQLRVASAVQRSVRDLRPERVS